MKASLSDLFIFHFIFYSPPPPLPSSLFLLDGFRPLGGISVAGGPAGSSEVLPPPPPTPSLNSPFPSAGGRQDLHNRRPEPRPPPPERDVSLSGNDGEGVTVAAGGQRV